MLGADGEPWVWVMGEHEDDLSIEDILEHEAKQAARNLALHEAQQLRWVATFKFIFKKLIKYSSDIVGWRLVIRAYVVVLWICHKYKIKGIFYLIVEFILILRVYLYKI